MTTSPTEITLLARHIGRVVTAEGEWGNECWSKPVNGKRLYLLKNVIIFPNIACAHLWVELDQRARRRLYPGDRFSFTARVAEYTRADGQTGVTLAEVRVKG